MRNNLTIFLFGKYTVEQNGYVHEESYVLKTLYLYREIIDGREFLSLQHHWDDKIFHDKQRNEMKFQLTDSGRLSVIRQDEVVVI